jgi:hypothetical protein
MIGPQLAAMREGNRVDAPPSGNGTLIDLEAQPVLAVGTTAAISRYSSG